MVLGVPRTRQPDKSLTRELCALSHETAGIQTTVGSQSADAESIVQIMKLRPWRASYTELNFG